MNLNELKTFLYEETKVNMDEVHKRIISDAKEGASEVNFKYTAEWNNTDPNLLNKYQIKQLEKEGYKVVWWDADVKVSGW